MMKKYLSTHYVLFTLNIAFNSYHKPVVLTILKKEKQRCRIKLPLLTYSDSDHKVTFKLTNMVTWCLELT